MDEWGRSHLADSLRQRQDAIAGAWQDAIARTSFAPFNSVELRERLAALTGRAIRFLLTGAEGETSAEQIGTDLANLHLTQPEALGRTQKLLATELLYGLSPHDVVALRLRLAELLEGIATGFVRRRTDILLHEQESIRKALIGELRAAEQELRAARDGLEVQVADRTAELRESEERWRLLVSNSPDPVLTVDREGRVLYVNYVRPESGLTLQDVVGQRALDMAFPEQQESAEAALRRVFETGESVVHEVAVERPDGTTVWYACHIGPIWQDGQVAAALVVARNITERKRLEEMKDNLLRDVSHELRTPLARAQMSLEMVLENLEKSPVDKKNAANYGKMALESILHLGTMVKGILDLSRLEAGVAGFAHEAVCLPELIAAVAQEMEPLAHDKGLDLILHIAQGLPPVRGDREQLARVVRNLIDNAYKFSSKGQVVVSAGRQRDEIVVGVRDEGCGIVPENLARVFDRFFREDMSDGGVGVGLSMCKTIVEAHGGRIWAESAGRGKGARVSFCLSVPPDDGDQETDQEKEL